MLEQVGGMKTSVLRYKTEKRHTPRVKSMSAGLCAQHSPLVIQGDSNLS